MNPNEPLRESHMQPLRISTNLGGRRPALPEMPWPLARNGGPSRGEPFREPWA